MKFKKEYINEDGTPFSKEQFIEKIKNDKEFGDKFGELGPIYGKQWRSWGGFKNEPSGWNHGAVTHYREVPKCDQIANLINDLKTNPDSRRLMVSAWNVGELDQMVLPPCHYGFQVYTRELSIEERLDLASKTYKNLFEPFDFHKVDHEEIDKLYPVPKRSISLMWNQRSVDVPLGLPFNIASYGLLLEIIAKEVNMVPDELIGNLGDTHIYSNQVDGCLEQIGRSYTHEERKNLLKDAMSHRLYNKAVNELMPFGGGMSEYYEIYNIPKRTREPYPLPFINFNSEHWDKPFLELIISDNFCKCLLEEDIQLGNYQSHPAIKMPLSN